MAFAVPELLQFRPHQHMNNTVRSLASAVFDESSGSLFPGFDLIFLCHRSALPIQTVAGITVKADVMIKLIPAPIASLERRLLRTAHGNYDGITPCFTVGGRNGIKNGWQHGVGGTPLRAQGVIFPKQLRAVFVTAQIGVEGLAVGIKAVSEEDAFGVPTHTGIHQRSGYAPMQKIDRGGKANPLTGVVLVFAAG